VELDLVYPSYRGLACSLLKVKTLCQKGLWLWLAKLYRR
jgi:hypothetical protein